MKQQMLEEEVRNLKKTIEALTAELDQLYEGLNAWPRSLALATLARAEAAEAERDALTAERDIAVADFAALKLAIAAKGGNEHAPTQDAYDAACQALGKHRARAEAAEAERDALTAENNRLREALKPFANYAKSLKGWEPTDAVCLETGIDFERMVTAGDFFAARAALKGEQK